MQSINENENQYNILTPPGKAGEIYQHIYWTSFKKVPEVALAATLGFLAAISGRAYRTPTEADLSLYMLLVAQTGAGKDGIHKGIPFLLGAITQGDDNLKNIAMQFIKREDFASSQALRKELAEQPGFLWLKTEAGKLISASVKLNAPAHLSQMVTLLTTVYSTQYLEGSRRSDKLNNVAGVTWPALSFLGETTPEPFLNCLATGMQEDGFMSRLLTININSDVPLDNKDQKINKEYVITYFENNEYWKNLINHVLPFQHPDSKDKEPIFITYGEGAEDSYDYFNEDSNRQINNAKSSFDRSLYNRAPLNALKIASLLAVADNYITPVITKHHWEFAEKIINNHIDYLSAKEQSGDIGEGTDNKRMEKVLQVCEEYLNLDITKLQRRLKKDDLTCSVFKEYKLIPRNYIHMYTHQAKAFKSESGRDSQQRLLDEALKNLEKNGHLKKFQPWAKTDDVFLGSVTFNFKGEVFQIMQLM